MNLRAIVVIWLAMAGSAAAQPPIPLGTPSPVQEPAKDPEVTWGAEVDVSSRYIWHGLPFSTGMVVWPWAWVSTKGVTLTFWTNFDRSYVNTTPFNPDRLPGPTFNEYDVAVAYERALGKVTLTGTFNRYTYREATGVVPQSTSEAIGRFAFAVGPGEIFTTHSFDVEKHRGAYYLEIGYAVERELRPGCTLKLDGGVAFWSRFAEKYHIASDDPLGPASLNVAVSQQITRLVAVRPHITFVRLLDAVARSQQGTPGVTYGIAVTFGS